MASSNLKHPWDYPDCPSCEHEIYVTNVKGDGYRCEFCGTAFEHRANETTRQSPFPDGNNTTGGTGIDPPTDEEIEQIYDEADKFVVSENNASDSRQHLHQNGNALCPDYIGSDDKRVVDSAVYPPGYNDFCKMCVKQWRKNDSS